MVTDEDSLARAAAGGDAAAFALLIAGCYDRIFGLAFRMTGARDQAEDLTQDICAALPDKLTGYAGRARFSTWLYRVVVNAAHDRRRRLAAQGRAAEGWGDWEQARRSDAATEADRTAWLMACLSRLPEDLRDTLALILDDLTHAEAAQVLGVSEGTVSWRVSQAKARLREMAAQEEYP